MKIQTFAKYLFVLAGAALLALCCHLLAGKLKFIASADLVQGQVVELQHVKGSDKNNTGGSWRPLVRFKAPSGALIDFTTPGSSGTPRYEVGESVQVYARRSNPADVMLDDVLELWGGPALAGIIGAAFLLLAEILRRIQRNQKSGT